MYNTRVCDSGPSEDFSVKKSNKEWSISWSCIALQFYFGMHHQFHIADISALSSSDPFSLNKLQIPHTPPKNAS